MLAEVAEEASPVVPLVDSLDPVVLNVPGVFIVLVEVEGVGAETNLVSVRQLLDRLEVVLRGCNLCLDLHSQDGLAVVVDQVIQVVGEQEVGQVLVEEREVVPDEQRHVLVVLLLEGWAEEQVSQHLKGLLVLLYKFEAALVHQRLDILVEQVVLLERVMVEGHSGEHALGPILVVLEEGRGQEEVEGLVLLQLVFCFVSDPVEDEVLEVRLEQQRRQA
mmetsp:Transcript_33004/g.50540  ORF Transcript_33004/g.50540 Transcript_33004/m.50540 type:complete len:219 (-) Transcript_33004:1015-1671(-)